MQWQRKTFPNGKPYWENKRFRISERCGGVLLVSVRPLHFAKGEYANVTYQTDDYADALKVAEAVYEQLLADDEKND